MRKRPRRSGRRRQASLFEEQAKTPRIVHEPETAARIVDALAELLLEAARPSRSAHGSGGQDDEFQDHG
jgi:hypothetical protein